MLTSLIISLGAVFSCRRHDAKQNFDYLHPEGNSNRVILRIESEEYKENDFLKYVFIEVGKDYRHLSSAALSRLIDQFVEEKLWAAAARQEGLSVSREEKESYKRRFLSPGEALGDLSVDEREITERVLGEKYLNKLTTGITITDEEVDQYYNLHQREFLLPERVKVSQILVESEAKAVRLRDQLKNNSDEAMFRRLARENSLGPEASRNGELGVFSFNELPQEMAKVIFELKEGEVSPVVESPYGFHIFRLDGRFEPTLLTREEAAAKIRVQLAEAKAEEIKGKKLEEIKANLDWEFFPDRLSFHYEKEDQ